MPSNKKILAPNIKPGTNGQVFVVENHDEAYYLWKNAKLKKRVLIHIDAHHDMYGAWNSSKRRQITIANFIFPAIEDQIIDKIYWVVPDDTWNSGRGRNDIVRAITKIDSFDGEVKAHLKTEDNYISSTILGKPLFVCGLTDLPYFDENVLLDIDVDFMIIPNIANRGIALYGECPWCWPSELIDRIVAKGIQSDFVTIAYSVEGGYTSLQWKYFGDELANRIKDPKNKDLNKAANLMREAVLCFKNKDYSSAEEKYKNVTRLWPEQAAPNFHLAHLYAENGQNDDVHMHYHSATEIDPSYGTTSYKCSGFWFYSNRRYLEAKMAFNRILLFEKNDVHALVGLGLIAIEEKHWENAELLLEKAILMDKNLVDTHRAIAKVLSKLNRVDDAIASYERSLMLVLAGNRPLLDEQIASYSREGDWSDTTHGEIHIRLAELYDRKKAHLTAIQSYRMGVTLGGESLYARRKMVLLYLKTHEWRRGGMEIIRYFKLIPSASMNKYISLLRYINIFGVRNWFSKLIGKRKIIDSIWS